MKSKLQYIYWKTTNPINTFSFFLDIFSRPDSVLMMWECEGHEAGLCEPAWCCRDQLVWEQCLFVGLFVCVTERLGGAESWGRIMPDCSGDTTEVFNHDVSSWCNRVMLWLQTSNQLLERAGQNKRNSSVIVNRKLRVHRQTTSCESKDSETRTDEIKCAASLTES